MSCVFLHESPEAFKDPLKFSPERWLSSDTRDMEPNLAPFSKGPRMWYVILNIALPNESEIMQNHQLRFKVRCQVVQIHFLLTSYNFNLASRGVSYT
jgi:hypothetical protein